MLQASLQDRERIPLSAPATRWTAYIRRYTQRTQEGYRAVLKRFLAQTGQITLAELSQHQIHAYLDKLLFKSCNRTANCHLTALKSFCRWLSDNYGIPNVAEKIPMLKEDPPRQRVISHEEYLKVLAVCKPHEVWIPKLLANTGLRATEFINLTPEDISDGWLTVRGKGRKLRMIPLNATCREILSEAHIPFLKSRKCLYNLLVRLSLKAGIVKAGPHSYRHYFATELYKRKIPISFISKLLGHSSEKTTAMIYCHFQHAFLEGVTDCLDK